MDVEVTPTDLKFRFQVNKQLPSTITIHNPTAERIAFKVKTTTPKKYVVRPSSGLVDPGTTTNVQVIMQAQKEFPEDFANCKDKFKVETLALEAGEDLTADTFKVAAGRVKDSKIRVVLEGPPAPPSPVPEVNETEEELAKSDKDNLSAGPVPLPLRQVAEPATETRQLRAQLERVKGERDDLKKKMTTGPAQSKGGFSAASLLSVLVVAILAFMVGHYFQPDAVNSIIQKVQELLGR